MPNKVSSLTYNLGLNGNPASVVDVFAQGSANLGILLSSMSFLGNMTPAAMDYQNIATPSAQAYYLNPNAPPGCTFAGPHTLCETIFDGAYKVGLPMVPTAC